MKGYEKHNERDNEKDNEKILNAENLNIDSTLKEISNQLEVGQTLILDVGNNYFNQTDIIYDSLVTRGYDVRKSFKNGRNQIIVQKKPENHRGY